MRPAVDPLSPLRQDPRGRAFDRVGALSVLLASLGARLFYLSQLRATPLFDQILPDAARHIRGAERIAGGDWLWSLSRPGGGALYDWILAAVVRLGGDTLLWPRLLQAVTGSAVCLMVFSMARRLMGRAAGLAAGLLAALYAPAIFLDGTLAPEPWIVLLVTAAATALVASEGSRRMPLLAAGLFLGLGALLRQSLLAAVPLVALWLAADTAIRGRMTGGRMGESAARVVALVAGVALALSPVAAGALAAPEPSGGAPAAESGPAGSGATAGPAGEAPPAAGAPAATPVRRILGFLSTVERSSGQEIDHHRRFVPALRGLPTWAFLFPLAAAGAVLCFSGWRDQLPLLAVAAGLLAPAIPVHDAGPFRMPLVPLLAIFAGGALAEIPSLLRAPRNAGRLATAAAFAGIALVIALAPPPEDALHTGRSAGRLAALTARTGRLEDAVALSDRGVRALESVYTGAGGSLSPEGRVAPPGDPGRPALGDGFYGLLTELCLDRSAMEASLGDPAAARRWSARAAAAAPESPAGRDALTGHAAELVAAGRFVEALPLVERARRLDPTALAPAVIHARALHGAGRTDEAVRILEAALAASPEPDPPDLAAANLALGGIFADSGDTARMRFHLRESLRLAPEQPRAGEIRQLLDDADRREGVRSLPEP